MENWKRKTLWFSVEDRWSRRIDSVFRRVFFFFLKDQRPYHLKPWAINWCLSGLDVPPVYRARIRIMVCVKAGVAVCVNA